LQKYRIAIIASLAKLVSVLLLKSDKELQKWNYFAQILLTEISEILVKVRLKQDKDHNINNDLLKSTFDYFDLSEPDIDTLLQNIYR
jgi:gluconate kinase